MIHQDGCEVIIEGVRLDQKDLKLLNLNGQVINQQFLYVNTYTGNDGIKYDRWKLLGDCHLSSGIYIINSGHLNTYLVVN